MDDALKKAAQIMPVWANEWCQREHRHVIPIDAKKPSMTYIWGASYKDLQ